MRWGIPDEDWHNSHNKEWHPFFAIIPRRLTNGSWVWLEVIEPRFYWVYPNMGTGEWEHYEAEYRLTPPSKSA